MGFAAVQILSGATKLSELAIDVSKDWLTYLIKGLGDPVDAQDADTKAARVAALAAYLLKSGGTMSGAIAMGTNKITGLGDPTAAQDADTRAARVAALAAYLLLAGGTMSGDIAMGTNKITGLGTPVASDDAARLADVTAAPTIVTSSYVGNATSRTISVGFKCSIVIVMNTSEVEGLAILIPGKSQLLAGGAIHSDITATAYLHATDGFTLTGTDENELAVVYYYWAISE